MEHYTSLLQALFFFALTFALGYLSIRRMRTLQEAVDREFQAALRRHHIDSYEVLRDRTRNHYHPEAIQVHRILRDDKGQHYLYVHISDSPGVMQALSRERALAALA
ncbi:MULTISPECIES: hypothetical protein [Pseudomonas]|uniref:DUF3301 domain-containing protein n=1 Tax=Pseudomonas donghuensis TaxID=1163398 RepID=A0AAP0XBE9_9PSED|nr:MULTISPECIES: hypothetical protein [Pseudomonas]MDF9892872.1 hypothetical protein [Pseudomonas vranovensis]KDO00878.1 hypothetical protein BV82_1332 [Pseudomonas donghuensis]MBS7600529.1 hypothetical protein [Pseudomonas sp. RC2C2]MCP6694142.1 hypothetical protein [Pseudomonas donghuensis]MCP6696392.1 hypothetical protein [Pseudomonas donghuensis]